MAIGFVPFIEDICDPAARLRGYDVVRGLRGEGVEVEIIPLARGAAYDVVVLGNYSLESALYCAAMVRRIKAAGRRVIFDFADDLDRVGREHLRSLRRRPFRERFNGRLDVRMRLAALADMLRAADYVTVSAAPLLRIAQRYNRNCRVIPDVIAPEFFALGKEHTQHQPVSIVWTGHQGNIVYLEMLEPALERLAGKKLPFELRVLTSVHSPNPYQVTYYDNREIVNRYHFPARFVEWRLDNAWSELFAGDIGVAPVPPGIVKSANKAATYMAMGLPAVASRTQEYCRAIEHGETGFLCSTAQEWEQALEELISSVQERARVGARGRAAVERMFSMRAVARQWWEVIRQVLKSG